MITRVSDHWRESQFWPKAGLWGTKALTQWPPFKGEERDGGSNLSSAVDDGRAAKSPGLPPRARANCLKV